MEQYDTEEDGYEALEKLKRKLMPWQREIVIGLLLLLIVIVVYMGFIYGVAYNCNELGGKIDADLTCHLDYNTTKPVPIDPWGIPNTSNDYKIGGIIK